MKLKVGIIGYGVVGKRRRLFIDKNPYLKIVAICDISFESKLDDARYYLSYKELVTNESLDVLFVCLPNNLAAEVTAFGLESGLHVFCEKPPGRDLDDIAHVRSVESRNPQLKLMYGFNHRYHDSIMEALKIVNSETLGKVINLKGVYGKSKILNYSLDTQWRTQREVAGGGILLDQGIHLVDLFRLFAGEFNQIHSFINNSYWKHDVEDNAYALMKTDDGIVGMLNSTATQWKHKFQLDIILELGSITLSGILSGSNSYGAETIKIIYKSDSDRGDPEEIIKRYNKDYSWEREISYFADSIIGNKKINSGSSFDAYKTMELVYKIYCADEDWKTQYNLTNTPSLLLNERENGKSCSRLL